MPSVGVCTRPADSGAPNLQVNARVTFSPIIQSASARQRADSYSRSNSRPGRSEANPSLIALSVCEEIQSRRNGFFQPAIFIIQRASSSPSRAASVATISSSMSCRFISCCTALYCWPVSRSTFSLAFSGRIGKSSSAQLAYLLL
ncbi:hypothetical protein D3C73_913630 [compost metagenome]